MHVEDLEIVTNFAAKHTSLTIDSKINFCYRIWHTAPTNLSLHRQSTSLVSFNICFTRYVYRDEVWTIWKRIVTVTAFCEFNEYVSTNLEVASTYCRSESAILVIAEVHNCEESPCSEPEFRYCQNSSWRANSSFATDRSIARPSWAT